jgi:c-di-GMP-binding flagellar brake protein YcgR
MGESDQRQEIRVRSVNLVSYSATEEDAMVGTSAATLYSILGTARTKDISAGGCLLVTSQEIPAGFELSFDLQLAERVVHCVGRVTRVVETKPGEEWEAGVEFTDLDGLAEAGLRIYLEFKGSDG